MLAAFTPVADLEAMITLPVKNAYVIPYRKILYYRVGARKVAKF